MISLRNRELIALLYLCLCCLVAVLSCGVVGLSVVCDVGITW